jgi:hypothetical protein
MATATPERNSQPYPGSWIRGVLLATVFVLSYAAFSLNSPPVSGDLPFYLAAATSLATGHGYVDAAGSAMISRGPGFPLLLSVTFRLFGFDFWVAFATIWVSAAAAATGLVWLAFRWWGLAPALATFVFYLGCPTVLTWSSNHLDEVWIAYLVGVLWAATKVVDTGTLRWGLALGLILSAGVLTKEVLILLAPLPFLALLSQQNRPAWKPAALGYLIGLGVPLLVWTLFVIEHGGDASWGIIGPVAAGTTPAIADGSAFRGSLSDVFAYLRNAGLSPLLIGIALVASPVLALRGSTADRLVLWALVLLAPFFAYTMFIQLRPGQLIPLVMLTALILGRLTALSANRIAYGHPAIATALSLLVALTMTLPDHQAIGHHLNGTRIAALLRGETRGTYSILFSANKVADAVQSSGLDETAPLLVYDTELNCYSCSVAYFQTKGKRRYLHFPFFIATRDNLQLSAWLPQVNERNVVDYLRPQLDPMHKRHRLWLLDLLTLQNYAVNQGARHLVVLEQGNAALMTLMAQSGFVSISSRYGYRIYRIDGQITHATETVIEGKENYCSALRHMSKDDFLTYTARFKLLGDHFEELLKDCRG